MTSCLRELNSTASMTGKPELLLQARCTSARATSRRPSAALSRRPAGAWAGCRAGRGPGRAAGRTWGAWRTCGTPCRRPWSCPRDTPRSSPGALQRSCRVKHVLERAPRPWGMASRGCLQELRRACRESSSYSGNESCFQTCIHWRHTPCTIVMWARRKVVTALACEEAERGVLQGQTGNLCVHSQGAAAAAHGCAAVWAARLWQDTCGVCCRGCGWPALCQRERPRAAEQVHRRQ